MCMQKKESENESGKKKNARVFKALKQTSNTFSIYFFLTPDEYETKRWKLKEERIGQYAQCEFVFSRTKWTNWKKMKKKKNFTPNETQQSKIRREWNEKVATAAPAAAEEEVMEQEQKQKKKQNENCCFHLLHFWANRSRYLMMSQRQQNREKKSHEPKRNTNERAIERKLGIIQCTFHEFPIATQTQLQTKAFVLFFFSLSLVLSLIVTDLHWFAVHIERPTDRPTLTNFDMLRYLPESSCLVWHSPPLPLSPFSFPSDHPFCSINFLLDFFLSLHSSFSLSHFICVDFCVQRVFDGIVSYTNECTLHTYTHPMQRITTI